MIKVSFVITELEVGGAERCLTNLAGALQQRSFQTAVIVLAPPPAAPQDGLSRQLAQAGVPVEFLGRASKWSVLKAVRQLRRCLAEQAPDVVQSMLHHANVVTRLAWGQRGPWCAGIRVADPSRWRQLLERRALATARKVVCVSQQVARYAQQRMAVPADRTVVIPNGIDVDRSSQPAPADLQPLGVPSSQRAITCIARLARQKAIDQLLAAAPHFLRQLPHHDLLLVGDGPEAATLRQLAGQSAVSERIHFCGWQPHVREILLASDLLVLPSRWEGMPNVLLEAMGAARPVVCTQAEGVREVLGPLAESQSVPVGDSQVFAEKVVSILSEPSRAQQLGQENRRRVAQHYSLDAMIGQYAQLYLGISRGV